MKSVRSGLARVAAGGTLIVVPTTTQRLDKVRIYEVVIAAGDGVPETSKALTQHIRVVDIEERVIRPIGRVSPEVLGRIDDALPIVLGIS
jgi:mRNA-degrading endonuclease toxin of MazEF toxin-antitoxin module